MPGCAHLQPVSDPADGGRTVLPQILSNLQFDLISFAPPAQVFLIPTLFFQFSEHQALGSLLVTLTQFLAIMRQAFLLLNKFQ